MIKGFILDMDGTILDSMSMWDNLGIEFIKGLNLTPKENLRSDLYPLNMSETLEYLKENYLPSSSKEEIYSMLYELLKQKYSFELKLKNNVEKFLQTAHLNGIKMFIATATPKELTMVALNRLGITNLFEGVITVGEIGIGKRKPDIYYYALKCLGTKKEETVVFEDASHAIDTVSKAGFRLCGIYDKSVLVDYQSLMKKCEWFIFDFDEWKFDK